MIMNNLEFEIIPVLHNQLTFIIENKSEAFTISS